MRTRTNREEERAGQARRGGDGYGRISAGLSGQSDVAGASGSIRSSSYPPQIWAEYGECRSVRAFGPVVGSSVGCYFFVRSVTGQPVRVFEADMGGLVVVVLI